MAGDYRTDVSGVSSDEANAPGAVAATRHAHKGL